MKSDNADIWSRLAEQKDAWPTIDDYRDRFDTIVPGEWDVTFERLNTDSTTGWVIKCRVQILGVIREGIGENERPRTARNQAFLEACAMFGVGRITAPQT